MLCDFDKRYYEITSQWILNQNRNKYIIAKNILGKFLVFVYIDGIEEFKNPPTFNSYRTARGFIKKQFNVIGIAQRGRE